MKFCFSCKLEKNESEFKKGNVMMKSCYNCRLSYMQNKNNSSKENKTIICKTCHKRNGEESFKKIRSCILKNLNPEQKRKLISDIGSEEKDLPRKVLSYLSEWIRYIDEEDQEAFSLFISCQKASHRYILNCKTLGISKVFIGYMCKFY